MTIRRNEKEIRRPRICTYDFEWYPDTLQLRLCGIWDAGRYHWFRTMDEFFNFVLRPEYCDVWFFAHAGGTSDFLFFLDWIVRHREWQVNIRYSSSAAVHVEFVRGKHKWIFVDSFFLMRTSLRKIAKFIGMEKGGEAGSVELFYSQSEEELREYNAMDCEILYKALQVFGDLIYDLGGELKPTIASCAMTLFRRKYLRADIRTYDKANDVLRQCYIASRVEVFRKSGDELYQYDINSSFPFSMTSPAPGQLKMVTKKVPAHGEMFFVDATINIPPQHVPPLPYRMGGRVYFPTGRWRSWFTGVDFREAELYGQIEKVHAVWIYEGRMDMAAYVEDIYEKRRKSEDESFLKEVLKYLLNSLYGKFGEQTEKTSVIINPRSRDVLLHPGAHQMMPGVVMITEDRAIAHEHVPFAAHITANSRRLISNYLRQCGDPYYCDSVTGDRTVVVRRPDGRTEVMPIEQLWELADGNRRRPDGKETAGLPGWWALTRSLKGEEGWFPIQGILRHATTKELWKISTKDGQTEVTVDHGLVVNGRAVKPEDFVREGLRFDTVMAQPSRELPVIDLWPYLKGHHDELQYKGQVGDREFLLSADGKRIVLKGTRSSALSIQRRYAAGSAELRALLRLVGAYVSEGSSSLIGQGSKRNCFSICQKGREGMDSLRLDLGLVSPGTPAKVRPTGHGMFALRSESVLLPALFGLLCGRRSAAKKLPAFAYDLKGRDREVLWTSLVRGDGWIESRGQRRYVTGSQTLAAGVSYMLSQAGDDHSISFIPKKRAWVIRCRPIEGRNGAGAMRVSRRRPDTSAFVYDLSVAGAQTFVDGIGRVVCRNTDCVVTKDATLPCSDKLGDLKLESKIKYGEFYAPKFYQMDVYQKDGSVKHKVKAKGFSRVGGVAFDHLVRRGLPADAVDQLYPPGEGQMSDPAAPCSLVSNRQPAVVIERMARSRELLMRGRTMPLNQLIPKQLRFENDKRVFEKGGHQSRPYSLVELEKLLGPAGQD